MSPAACAARHDDELPHEDAHAELEELEGYEGLPSAVATATTSGDEDHVPAMPAHVAEVPVEVLTPTSECELDSNTSSRTSLGSDDPGKYTDYDEDMFNYMYYGVPLPGMKVTPQAEQSISSERDIEELALSLAADDTADPDWGLTAPPTVSGTNPGMLQE